MNSTHQMIETHIQETQPGTILFPADFRGLGSEEAIKKTLSRLSKEGILDRVAHGIYLLPQYDEELGKLAPSMESIAEAIAAREHVRIIPTRATALNKLGLSTQIPMNVVYLTDGQRRRIRVGKRSLLFKATTPKKFAFKGQISGQLILGLEDQGIETLSEDMKDKVSDLLNKEQPDLLKHDLKLAPAKIHDFLLSLKKRIQKHEVVQSS